MTMQQRLWSLSNRFFVVALTVLVLPLMLQSTVLVVELLKAWDITQFDTLVKVSEERLGLARSWVADRNLFATTVDEEGSDLTTDQVARLTPGAGWVDVIQQGPLLIVDPSGPHNAKVLDEDRLAYLLGEQVLFIPPRRPIQRGLIVPKKALENLLLTDNPTYPLEIRTELGGWKSAQKNQDQIWLNSADGEERLASGSFLNATNFYVLTLAPTSQELPSQLRDSALRLLMAIAITIGVGLLLTWLAVRRLTKPLRALQQAMIKAGEGDWTQRVPVDPWAFELNVLGNTFNRMLASLQSISKSAASEQQQRLTLETELNLGREVQRALLPQRESRVPGIDIAAWYQSARETGGDFYDYFGSVKNGPESGELHFCIADVSGKGLSACLFSLTFRALLRAFSQSKETVAAIARHANEVLCWDTNSSGYFVTAWVGCLHANGTCEYVCAGHPMAILKRADGQLEKLTPRGLAFGVERTYAYAAQQVQIQKDDLLVLYTDGLIEQNNPKGEFYGEKRLWSCLQGCAPGLTSQDIILKIRQDLANFAGEADQHDDLTILVIIR